MEGSTLEFTYHASQRQKQRFIPRSDVVQTVSDGNKVNFGWNNGSVHYSKNIKVVTRGSTVVTVAKNERNAKFDLLKNSNKSIEFLTYQVEVKDNDHAMCELAEIYRLGVLINRDVVKAHELYMHAALLGNSHAMVKLSIMYGDGSLGKVDEELKNKWMKYAAGRGNVYALGVTGQELLVECIKNKRTKGSFCEETAAKAMDYLEKAAAKGSTRALWTIGFIYEFGHIKEKDISRAIDYYSQAAKTGSPASVESLYKLSQNCLYSADKLEDILNYLVGYLAKSSVGMLCQIGESQLNGEVGYSKSRGLNMIEAAAKCTNFEEAMILLAKCYRVGKGCNADLRLCQYWYNRLYSLYETSAKQGNVDSVWKLGKFHMKGYVGDIDFDRAESFFKQAISMSNRTSFMFNLGDIYRNGLLGDKDPKAGEEIIKEALLLEEKTAMEGNAESCYVLYKYYALKRFSFHSYEKAMFWLTKSVNLENPKAELRLCEIYLNKCSRYNNTSEGLRIFEKLILLDKINFIEGYFIIKDILESEEFVTWLKEKIQLKTDHRDVSSCSNSEMLTQEHSKTDDLLLIKRSLDYLGCIKSISQNDKSYYLYRLYTEFQDLDAIFELSTANINGVLPNDLIVPVTKWMVDLPELLCKADTLKLFFEGASLLGTLFKTGKIHPVNLMESAKWLCICEVEAMKQNTIATNNILGNLSEEYNDITEELFNSGFVATELIKLIQHFKNVFPLLYKILCRMLGDIFYGGHLVLKDIDKAISWYSEASLLNNSRATLTLAQIYRHDENKINLYRSLRYYKLAVKQGCETAINELVTLIDENDKFKTHLPFLNNYQHESSISADIISGILPFKKLTKYPLLGEEMYELGMEYLNKNDSSINCLNNAVFWLRKASKRCDYKATAELYKLYKSGKVGSQVLSLADFYKDKVLKCIFTVLKRKRKDFSRGKTLNKDNLLEKFKYIIEILTRLKDEDIFQRLLDSINGIGSADVIDDLSQAISLCEKAISESRKCS